MKAATIKLTFITLPSLTAWGCWEEICLVSCQSTIMVNIWTQTALPNAKLRWLALILQLLALWCFPQLGRLSKTISTCDMR